MNKQGQWNGKWQFIRCLLAMGVGLWSFVGEAKDATVFDARRPIALENNEIPQKDFYINAGARDGLKKGMSVPVYRRTNLYDQYQNKSLSDLVVLVGHLKIIHVQDDVSVGRVEEIKGRETSPNLEFDAIMVGDKVTY